MNMLQLMHTASRLTVLTTTLAVVALTNAQQLPEPATVEPEGTETLDELLASLAEGGFVERELVSRRIETSRYITLEAIETALNRDDLDPEQRQRLLGAGRRKFFTQPRAAMGIQLGPMTVGGLQITGTTPGFNAAEILQQNDVLASINGHAIASVQDLQVAIISRSPGETVPVVVLRGPESMALDVTLGAWSALGQRATPGLDVLERSWSFRFGGSEAGTQELIPLLGEPRSSQQDDATRRGQRPTRAGWVVGGEPRLNAGLAAGIRLDRPLDGQDRQNAISYADRLAAKLLELEDRRQRTLRSIEHTESKLEAFRREGNDASITDYAALLRQHQQTLDQQEAEIRTLRAELVRLRQR